MSVDVSGKGWGQRSPRLDPSQKLGTKLILISIHSSNQIRVKQSVDRLGMNVNRVEPVLLLSLIL